MAEQENGGGGGGAPAEGQVADEAASAGQIPAALLRLVRRPEVKDGRVVMRKEKGDDVPVLRALRSDEVFEWAESATSVVVITVDGQRYRGEKPAAKPAKA